MVNGLPMHARLSVDSGLESRPAVVLVHWLVVSSRYMLPVAERLAPYYRIYAPDLPGFGKSAKPPRVLDVAHNPLRRFEESPYSRRLPETRFENLRQS